MLPYPQSVIPKVPAYQPLFDMLETVMIDSATLSSHWSYSENHLCNLRRLNKGPPWVKLPTGGVRYRLSEVLASEIAGTSAALTLERVLLAVSACTAVPLAQRGVMLAHLEAALAPGK